MYHCRSLARALVTPISVAAMLCVRNRRRHVHMKYGPYKTAGELRSGSYILRITSNGRYNKTFIMKFSTAVCHTKQTPSRRLQRPLAK